MIKGGLVAGIALASVMAATAMSQDTRVTAQKNAQIATPGGPNVGIAANRIERQNGIMRLSGNVRIRTREMILTTNEASYNEATGEVEAQGTVHIKLEAQN